MHQNQSNLQAPGNFIWSNLEFTYERSYLLYETIHVSLIRLIIFREDAADPDVWKWMHRQDLARPTTERLLR